MSAEGAERAEEAHHAGQLRAERERTCVGGERERRRCGGGGGGARRLGCPVAPMSGFAEE